ncbi:hypothetical protein C5610_12400 [Idiomarina sp. OT37-5b]|uniref:META domain-containing protein n=1 Tax=Idiomarina sp. OT37-5b TaxID=2100422 RepID=UPI000CF8A6B2|nr:META domain-containing protein [Idiomarina sp. OT37-5b]AVJ57011.1 hypothetical protein C5610_12400 [Idiomarina sp. OT37-5b]
MRMRFKPVIGMTCLGLLLSSCSVTKTSPEPTAYDCGIQPITVVYDDQNVTLSMRSEQQVLAPVKSASGARFVSTDERTEYWSKGHEAQVTWKGEALPQCIERGYLPRAIALRGNEPFWLLTINQHQASYTTPSGEEEFAVDQMDKKQQTGGWQIEIDDLGHLTMTQKVCYDSMSGKAFPYHASGKFNGVSVQGCGGDTEQLIQGQPWQIESLSGIAERLLAKPELQFLPQGRLVGSDGCNRFFGHYSVQGEIPRLNIVGSTKRLCTQETMDLAQKFTELLNNTVKVDIKDNSIVLVANDGQQLSLKPAY